MRVLFIAVIFALSASAVQAQSVEAFLKFDKNGKIVNKDANMAFSIELSKDTTSFCSKVKFTSFILIEPTWGEQMFGLSYAPADWIEVGLAAGFEQNPNIYRGCATLWLGKGHFSSFTAFERGIGKDNWWYRNITTYKATDKFNLGLQAWRFNGIGPLAEYTIIDHVKVWVNPVLDPERSSGDNIFVIVGFGVNF